VLVGISRIDVRPIIGIRGTISLRFYGNAIYLNSARFKGLFVLAGVMSFEMRQETLIMSSLS
jgi:hypothetical protein